MRLAYPAPLRWQMMKHASPLRKWLQEYAQHQRPTGEALRQVASRPGAASGYREQDDLAEFLPYGPPDDQGRPICEILATCGEVEAEYAAIRRGAALLDCPNRGTLIVTGADRRDFLNRMVTQELKDVAPGCVREGFLLNRKGRIEADLRLIEFGDLTVIDVDVHQVDATVRMFEGMLFSEDVEVRDACDQWCHIEIHGPRALELLGAATDTGPAELAPGRAVSLRLGESDELFVARVDQTGETGLVLLVPRVRVIDVWSTLAGVDERLDGGRRRMRPIGWFAYNIARIEAGMPLMNIDFGTASLPHETGLLRQRVSFTKGCYPGQEVVARMEHLGRPKQVLAGLRMQDDVLPVAGMPVYEHTEAGAGGAIGEITSSTMSPMLGSAAIAFARLRTTHADEGATVMVSDQESRALATVQALRFLPETVATPATGARAGGV